VINRVHNRKTDHLIIFQQINRMSGYKSVLIVGSSGGIGKHITNGFLKAKPSWKVSLLVNSDTLKEPTKKQIYDEFTSKGAQLITGEVEKPETYQDKIKGIEVVVSAISGRVVKAQIPLIHAAKHAGVKLFIPSEFGFDSSSVRITRTFAPKAEIQKEIKKKLVLTTYSLLLDYSMNISSGQYSKLIFKISKLHYMENVQPRFLHVLFLNLVLYCLMLLMIHLPSTKQLPFLEIKQQLDIFVMNLLLSLEIM